MDYKGFCDLCVNYDGGDKKKLHRLLSRLHEMGYKTIAVNQTLDESALEVDKKKKKGQKGDKTNDALNTIVHPLDIEDVKHDFKDKLVILSRLTFSFTDSTKTYTLAQCPGLKKFDLYGITPKNQQALQFACAQLSFDILSIQPGTSGLRFTRKLYLQAVERGVHFEIHYGDLIDRVNRKNTIHYSHLFHVYGKSKNVIVSSGSDDWKTIRNPYDIINLGAILGLTEVRARAAISSQCKHLILKAEGRRFGKAVFAIKINADAAMDSEDDIEKSDDEELFPISKKLKT